MMLSQSGLSEPNISAQKVFFLQRAIRNLGLESQQHISTAIERLDKQPQGSQQISLSDIAKIYKEISHYDYSGIGLAIGKQVTCSDYGIYGCTLMSKKTLGQMLEFATRYHALVTRTAQIYLRQNEDASWLHGCTDILYQPTVREFNLELQCTLQLALTREVLGDSDFTPNCAR